MGTLTQANLSELMADSGRQSAVKKLRKLPYVERDIRLSEVPDELELGWYKLKELKTRIKVAKDKSHDELLEDAVWTLLADMGFDHLSVDRNVTIRYSKDEGAKQQVDVVAVDGECAVVVECKSSSTVRKGAFKETIEAIGGKREGIINELKSLFKKPKLKVAFVLVTENYQVAEADLQRMEAFRIRHLSERDLKYFRELTDHLGIAARFQFHGDLFGGQDIPHMQNKIAAIQGKMGGHTYYSFSIEPAKLLKLGFVLHRTKSVRLTPSYQRLIKKARLSKIQSFVAGGGFFPNSLLVAIDSGGKNLRFDLAANQIEESVTKFGILHLPPRYRSIYVIDGQHRLYAYSGSEYAGSNAIPVVAFVDLERSEQLRLFMEINENQKAVSKNLKNTLDADLKWDSANLRERADGLRKQISLDLGDEVQSPLYGRVQVGEDERTETRIVTLEAILKGLNRTRFVGKYTRNAVKEHGLFDSGSSEHTLQKVLRFLFAAFQFSQERMPGEWSKRPDEGAVLSVNAGVTAYIWILGDALEHLIALKKVEPLTENADALMKEVSYYLDGIVAFMSSLSFEERMNLRTKYGSGGDTRLWRVLQRAINEFRPDFQPDGLDQYWKDQSKQFNLETYEKLGDIEVFFKEQVREGLQQSFSQAWLKKGIPGPLFEKLHSDAAKKNREIVDEKDEKQPWDCMYIINYRDVVSYGANWSNIFQKKFTIPGQEKLKKDDKTKWMVRLNTIRNQNVHDHSVSEDEYKFVCAVHDWLITDDDEAIQQYATFETDEIA